MNKTLQQALRVLLAIWLVGSVLAAGSLVHLPELHAKLHCEGTASCCATGCSPEAEHDHGHGHSHDHDSELPNDHQCLTELLAGGCVDAPVAVDFVPTQFVALSEASLLEPTAELSGYSASAVPGRAPPIG